MKRIGNEVGDKGVLRKIQRGRGIWGATNPGSWHDAPLLFDLAALLIRVVVLAARGFFHILWHF